MFLRFKFGLKSYKPSRKLVGEHTAIRFIIRSYRGMFSLASHFYSSLCPNGNFNCPHVNWGYRTSSADGECLVAWPSLNNLVPLHDPKDVATFHFGRWNTGTNPDLTFSSIGPDSRVPDRRILEKFLRSQYRPSHMVPSRLALPVPGKPVKWMGLPQGQLEPLQYIDQQTCQGFVATRFTGCESGLPGLLQCHQNSSQKFYPTRSSK